MGHPNCGRANGKLAFSVSFAITDAHDFNVKRMMLSPGNWICDALRGGRLMPSGGGMRLRLVAAGILVLACGAGTGCKGFFVYPGSLNTTATGASTSTTTLVSSASSEVVGGSVVLTATVSPSAATGTVTFYDNASTSLGTVALSSSQATVTTTSLALGTQSLTAVYSGDGNYAASTSSPVTVTVTATATAVVTTVAASETSTSAGQATTLTATLSDATATGVVNFYSNGNMLLGRAAASGGLAVLNTTALPVGSDSVTAIYSGDAGHGSSASSGVDVSVGQAE